MTAGSGPQDYPDYIRLQQQSAPLAFFLSQAATVTPTASAWIYVGNVSHLIINCSTGSFAVLAKAVFLFADDNAGTNATHKTTAWCDLTHPTRAIIPAMGNWMQVTTSSTAGDGSGQGLAMYAEGVSYVPRPGLIADPADGLHGTVAGVATGIVQLADLARTVPGLWQFSVTSDQVGTTVEVQQEFTTGVWSGATRVTVTVGDTATGQVGLVAAPTRLLFTNNAAPAANMRYVLQAVG